MSEELHDIFISMMEEQRKYVVQGHNKKDTQKLVDGKTVRL